MIFTRDHKVRFSDTDYAGIMFYPRYFEMLNAVVEDWFEDAVGASFPTLLDDYQLGSPLGGIKTDFLAPCRLGETLTFHLSASRLGEKSVTFDVAAECDGEIRVRSALTHVCVKRDISGAAPWPDDVRAAMTPFLKTDD